MDNVAWARSSPVINAGAANPPAAARGRQDLAAHEQTKE